MGCNASTPTNNGTSGADEPEKTSCAATKLRAEHACGPRVDNFFLPRDAVGGEPGLELDVVSREKRAPAPVVEPIVRGAKLSTGHAVDQVVLTPGTADGEPPLELVSREKRAPAPVVEPIVSGLMVVQSSALRLRVQSTRAAHLDVQGNASEALAVRLQLEDDAASAALIQEEERAAARVRLRNSPPRDWPRRDGMKSAVVKISQRVDFFIDLDTTMEVHRPCAPCDESSQVHVPRHSHNGIYCFGQTVRKR